MLQQDLLILQFDLLELSIHLAYVMTLSEVMPYDNFYAFLFAMLIYTEMPIGIASYAIFFDESLVVIGRE